MSVAMCMKMNNCHILLCEKAKSNAANYCDILNTDLINDFLTYLGYKLNL